LDNAGAGRGILDLALARASRRLFVVGTAKNVGKTVTTGAIYAAALAAGLRIAVLSTGRDGESFDAVDGIAKPRLFVRPGTVVATAAGALSAGPAAEVLDVLALETAAGPVTIARMRQAAYVELIGPPTAAGVARTLAHLDELSDLILVDGAIDRVAALAGSSAAVVIATGAATAGTPEAAIDAARILAARLRLPTVDPAAPSLRIQGALTASKAAPLIEARERRQVVIGDPTQFALAGRAADAALQHLDVRCERPLHPVAATVASIGRGRSFEPRSFARGVALGTGLPTFDVYAGERTA
jgi:hypothetical protein